MSSENSPSFQYEDAPDDPPSTIEPLVGSPSHHPHYLDTDTHDDALELQPSPPQTPSNALSDGLSTPALVDGAAEVSGALVGDGTLSVDVQDAPVHPDEDGMQSVAMSPVNVVGPASAYRASGHCTPRPPHRRARHTAHCRHARSRCSGSSTRSPPLAHHCRLRPSTSLPSSASDCVSGSNCRSRHCRRCCSSYRWGDGPSHIPWQPLWLLPRPLLRLPWTPLCSSVPRVAPPSSRARRSALSCSPLRSSP